MVDEKGQPILDNQGKPMYQPERVAIHGDIDENFLLLDADPGYKATIAASASSHRVSSKHGYTAPGMLLPVVCSTICGILDGASWSILL
jgi:hypothetical protein